MTGPKPSAHRQLLDDQLLDALGRGSEPPDGADADRLVAGLAAWRSDLAAQLPPATLDLATVLPPAPAADRSRFRWRRLVAGAGAALAVAGGGGAVAVAAAGAGPDSPLWPITRLVHPERAEARVAQLAVEEVVAQAREAVADRRYADAVRLLGEAEQLATRVPGEADRQRLLAEVAQVRTLLPVGLPDPELPHPPPGLPATEAPPSGQEGLPVPDPDPDPVVPGLPAGEPTSGPEPGTDPDPDPDPVPEPSPDPVPEPPLPLPLPSPPALPP